MENSTDHRSAIARSMMAAFVENHKLAEVCRESSLSLLDLIDRDYFSKDVRTTDPDMVRIVETHFKEKDPATEVRLYKLIQIIYAMIVTFEEMGVVSIVKRQPETMISREKMLEMMAQKIWKDYLKKKIKYE